MPEVKFYKPTSIFSPHASVAQPGTAQISSESVRLELGATAILLASAFPGSKIKKLVLAFQIRWNENPGAGVYFSSDFFLVIAAGYGFFYLRVLICT